MTQRLTVEDIKRAANNRPHDVLRACGVVEDLRGGYIAMCDPMTKDRHPSLVIWFKNGTLSFKRYPGGPGRQGDVFDLVAYLNGWIDQPKRGIREACRLLCDVLRLDNVSPADLERDRAIGRKRAREIEKKSAEDQAKKEGAAMALWLNATPIAGTATEIYLRQARGVDIDLLPRGPRGGDRTPSIIRHIDSHKHSDSGKTLPCMIAGCVDYREASPRIRAVHRTWLKPDGSGKADVKPQRKVWPGFAGLVIPIWRGEQHLSIAETIAHGICETLVLTEGVEDGLTAALADPTHRVWAMISLSNMPNVPVPECIDGIIVHRQNDWLKREAVEAFERGMTALERTGRPVAEVAALGGKDLNDTLRGEV